MSEALMVLKFKNNEVRTVRINDEPWWVAKDVCNVLEIKNVSDAVDRLDSDERGIVSNDTPSGTQEMLIVNEQGLYSLILGSKKPEAKEFKRWVTHEVLPSLRKYGSYSMSMPKSLPEALELYLAEVKAKEVLRIEKESLQKTLFEQSPIARLYHRMASTEGLYSLSEAAKVIWEKGSDIGRNRLARWLRENGYFITKGSGTGTEPFQNRIEQELFVVKLTTWRDSSGKEHHRPITFLTQKGLQTIAAEINGTCMPTAVHMTMEKIDLNDLLSDFPISTVEELNKIDPEAASDQN